MITVIFKYDNTQILHFLLLQKYPQMSLVITQGISQTRSDRVIIAFFISLFSDMLHKKLQGKRNRRNGKEKYYINFMFYTYMH